MLAGAINTRFVAAVNAAGGRAVGLTGADAGVATVKKAPAHRATSGELVDLGLVGEPVRSEAPPLVRALVGRGFVPVIACIGASRKGDLFNVNADTLAGNLAARLRATRLVIAGGTAGVLDEQGQTIPSLDPRDIRALVKAGTATCGDGGQADRLRGGRARGREGRNDCGRTRRQAAGAVAAAEPPRGDPPGTRDEGTEMTTSQQVQELESRHVLQTYKRQPVVLVRGDGRRLFDVEGREYLDFLSGIGVVVLGQATRGWPRSSPIRRRP